jgi:4-aminobutyrate aminotransferase-like enzyme
VWGLRACAVARRSGRRAGPHQRERVTDPSAADQADLARAARHLVRYSGAGEFLPFVAARAAGSFVCDASGRAVLNFTSGQMSTILSPAHPVVVEVVSTMVGRLDHLASCSSRRWAASSGSPRR